MVGIRCYPATCAGSTGSAKSGPGLAVWHFWDQNSSISEEMILRFCVFLWFELKLLWNTFKWMGIKTGLLFLSSLFAIKLKLCILKTKKGYYVGGYS